MQYGVIFVRWAQDDEVPHCIECPGAMVRMFLARRLREIGVPSEAEGALLWTIGDVDTIRNKLNETECKIYEL